MKNQNKELGFTLIELLVVIIVLGILALVANVKFVDFRRDGEIASVKTLAASFKQSLTFAHTKWQITGGSGAMNDLAGFAGGVLDINSQGYPIGIDKRNPMGAPNNIGRGKQGCVSLWNTLLTDPPSISLAEIDNGSDFQAYRHKAETNPDAQSQCTYVLRTLGDTQGYQDADIVINYNSVTGRVRALIN
ncbi:type II secretion system protein [Shewanella violacea]|uniref:Pilin, putative n=1 Tax=Shewanella violacea (strain JCM 10179 / CIP 106290 / LMG 19151 / DSS12) TaxID=637905 RepID=D4ZGH7_SHEVD|nr:type II secretion system protein [Shewanella violacea]BAJ00776.1 pilin, putative [Shewanella violacea DSS12]